MRRPHDFENYMRRRRDPTSASAPSPAKTPNINSRSRRNLKTDRTFQNSLTGTNSANLRKHKLDIMLIVQQFSKERQGADKHVNRHNKFRIRDCGNATSSSRARNVRKFLHKRFQIRHETRRTQRFRRQRSPHGAETSFAGAKFRREHCEPRERSRALGDSFQIF